MALLGESGLRLASWWLEWSSQATALMVAALLVYAIARRPARRLALVRSCWVGLAMLAVMSAWRHAQSVTTSTRALSSPLHISASPDIGCAPVATLDRRSCPPEKAPMSLSTCAQSSERSCGGNALVVSAQSPVLPVLGGMTLAFALGWLAIGAWARRALERSCRPAPDWVHAKCESLWTARSGRRCRVLVSSCVETPMATSWLRPTIVLPAASLDTLPRDQIDAVLAHEWAHVVHGDLAWQAFERLLMPLLAWNPLFHWLRARSREQQELLADVRASFTMGMTRVAYAEALMSWAHVLRNRSGPSRLLGALAFNTRSSQLAMRVRAMVGTRQTLQLSTGWAWRLASLATTLVVILALFLVVRGRVTAAEPAHAHCAGCTHAKPALLVFICPSDPAP